MVYSQETRCTPIMGLIMVAYAYVVQSRAMATVVKYPGTGRHAGESQILAYAFGCIAIAVGLWQLVAKTAEGHIDYYLSTVGGVASIMLVAFIVKRGLDPQMVQWDKAAQSTRGFNFARVMNPNNWSHTKTRR